MRSNHTNKRYKIQDVMLEPFAALRTGEAKHLAGLGRNPTARFFGVLQGIGEVRTPPE